MTTEERLDFSIRLATMEFQRLRAGDWLNLREDLAGFLSAGAGQSEPLEAFGGVGVGPLEQPLPRDFPEKAFRALQRDLADVLEAFAYWDGSPREPETARVGQVKTKKLSTLRYAVLPIQDGQVSLRINLFVAEKFIVS